MDGPYETVMQPQHALEVRLHGSTYPLVRRPSQQIPVVVSHIMRYITTLDCLACCCREKRATHFFLYGWRWEHNHKIGRLRSGYCCHDVWRIWSVAGVAPRESELDRCVDDKMKPTCYQHRN